MSASQYAVFHFDVKTMTARDADCRETDDSASIPVIFDSLAEAESYCKSKVTSILGLGCRMVDREGKVAGTFLDTALYEHFHGRPAAKKSLLLGAIFFIAGVGLITLDARMGFRLIFGCLFGIRLVWAGAVKIIDGFGSLNSK